MDLVSLKNIFKQLMVTYLLRKMLSKDSYLEFSIKAYYDIRIYEHYYPFFLSKPTVSF